MTSKQILEGALRLYLLFVTCHPGSLAALSSFGKERHITLYPQVAETEVGLRAIQAGDAIRAGK